MEPARGGKANTLPHWSSEDKKNHRGKDFHGVSETPCALNQGSEFTAN